MAYRAQPQSLYGNVGAPQAPKDGLDIAGAIGALSDSTSSFIHQAYLRKNAERQQQMQQDAIRRQEEHDQRTEMRADQEFAYKKEKDAADRTLKEREIRQKGLEGGITPGTEGGTTVSVAPEPVPTAPPVGSFQQPSSIKAAMQSGFNPALTPTSPLETPVTKGSLGTTPKLTYGQEAPTPDTFDPKKSAAYVRSTETANIRAQAAQDIEQQREAARATLQADRLSYMRETSKQLQKLRNDANGGAGGKGKAITANAREAAAAAAALGLIDKAAGSYDVAEQELNGENGKEFREFGVTTRHLLAAKAKWKTGATKAALGLQSGATGLSVDEAVGRVGETGAKIDSVAAGTKKLVKPSSVAPTAAPAQNQLVKPTASAKATTPTLDEAAMSDADLWEVKVKGGMTKDAATAYVTNRKKK